MGTGIYVGEPRLLKDTQLELLAAVKFPKLAAGRSNIDRWLSYLGRYRKVKRTIPVEELPHPKLHAKMLRDAVQPSVLRKLVAKSMADGKDPESKAFEPWRREAYGSPDKTRELIKQCAMYLDRQHDRGANNEI